MKDVAVRGVALAAKVTARADLVSAVLVEEVSMGSQVFLMR
jgi:hypothetical protein